MDKQPQKYRIAVATSDGIVVNQHFGRADRFQIYEVSEGDSPVLLETRDSTPVCRDGDHEEEQMQKRVEELSDCKYIIVSRIGQRAVNVLERHGIIPMELPGLIAESIQRLVAYEAVQSLLI